MSEDKLKIDRRSFIKTAAAAAGVAGLGPLQAMASSGIASSYPSDTSKNSQSNIAGKPNILIIMVDEQRYPTPYESDQLQAFRNSKLPGQESIRRAGMEFHGHHSASVACVPSRTSFYTGHYPSYHGVANTDGTAKTANDPDMFWLYPKTVPTIGNYFREGGYRTFYKGKWHISHADLQVPGTRESLTSYNEDGSRNPDAEKTYLAAKILEDYGFTGWIGPEPHGTNPMNSGSSARHATGRDPAIASQFIDLLDQLEADPDDTPWLSVCSFLNPHDIVLFGLFGRVASFSENSNFEFDVSNDVPSKVFTEDFLQTASDDLKNKPSVQASYRRLYKRVFQPLKPSQDYFRLYYQLHMEVDEQINKVYQRLQASRFFDNTIVVFTADHGTLLGSHGGLFQKWFTAYEEATHVPLIISHPSLIKKETKVDIPTSHVDILPTLLGLAGLDINSLQQQLSDRFTDAQLPVGRDLSSLIYGSASAESMEDAIYFMTDDDPSRGADAYNVIGVRYDPVDQPSHLETVIKRLDGKLWKYTRYFDNPQYWSEPGTPGEKGVIDAVARELGRNEKVGTHIVKYKKIVKKKPASDQYELYNMTDDPMELSNLAGILSYSSVESELKSILSQQSSLKRKTPVQRSVSNHGSMPGGFASLNTSFLNPCSQPFVSAISY